MIFNASLNESFSCSEDKDNYDIHNKNPPIVLVTKSNDLRLNSGIDATSHWTSNQRTLLVRRLEYSWDITDRSPASRRDQFSYKIRNVSADRN